MNKEKNTGTRHLAKEVIKGGRRRTEDEVSFPTYMVVLSRDKNDEIMIIPPPHPENIENSVSGRINIVSPESTKRLQSDKSMHKISGSKVDKDELVKK